MKTTVKVLYHPELANYEFYTEPEDLPLLWDFCKVREISAGEALHYFWRSFHEYMRDYVSGNLNPLLAEAAQQVYQAARQIPGRTVICEDCLDEGSTMEPDDGRIVICPSCLVKRREGKTEQQFLEELRRDYEKRKNRRSV